MAFSKSTLVAATLLAMSSAVSAQSSNASYEQVADIELTFPAADMTPVPIPASWLDISGVLNVTFGDITVNNIGDVLAVNQVQTAPSFRVSSETPLAAEDQIFASDKKFTVAFVDAGVAGKNVSTTVFTHYLGNNFVVDSSTGMLRNQTAARIEYGAPLPATNDGPHRYMQLVFQQYDNFTAPASPAAGAPIQNIDITTYYSQANGGLGKIVAANYIQIEVGQGTAPSATAPVSQASVTALAISISRGAASASGSASGSAASPASSGVNTKNGASSMAKISIGGVLAMGAAAVFGATIL